MKEKIKKIIKRTIIILGISILNLLTIMNACSAGSSGIYNIVARGDCSYLLKYRGEPVSLFYACYQGKLYNYPVYCLDETKQGVTNRIEYTIKIKNNLNDPILWRYITNGYPYKSLSELGCKSRDEAYVASQEAIYCYLHGHKIEDYEGIGEAGERTLEVMKNIIKNAGKSQELPAEKSVTIVPIQEKFEKDTIDENYVSKTYEVKSCYEILKYIISMDEENKNFKIVDLENKEKEEFLSGEKFKIIYPISELGKEGKEIINFQTKVSAKKIYEAYPELPEYQQYAIPGEIEEQIVVETIEEEYPEMPDEPEEPKEEIPEEPEETIPEEPKEETPKEPEKEISEEPEEVIPEEPKEETTEEPEEVTPEEPKEESPEEPEVVIPEKPKEELPEKKEDKPVKKLPVTGM